VWYITHGDVVHGHHFGFIKMAGNCDQDLLWITWATNKQGLQEVKGKHTTFHFCVGDTTFEIEIPLTDVYPFTSTLTIAGFTNSFIAGDNLISLLEKGHKIEVTISSPEALVNKLDVVTDSFSLNGFIAARIKSKELCEEM
jgi:hypothetical protein